MIEHMLRFYGINCGNKLIEYFTTGLSLPIFFALVDILISLKNFNDLTTQFFNRLFLLTLCASRLFSYLLIKYNSPLLLKAYRELREYQNECFISESNIRIYYIITILLSFLMTAFSTIFNFCEPYIFEIFEDLNETMNSLPIPPLALIFILRFYVNSWGLSMQLVYIDFKTRFISLIENFNKVVVRNNIKPAKNVLISTQRTIFKFVELKSEIKRNVDFLKYGISMEFFSTVALTVCTHDSVSNQECYYLSTLRIVLTIGYFLWTMSSNFRVRKAQNELSLNLNLWLNIEYETINDMENLKTVFKPFKEDNRMDTICVESGQTNVNALKRF